MCPKKAQIEVFGYVKTWPLLGLISDTALSNEKNVTRGMEKIDKGVTRIGAYGFWPTSWVKCIDMTILDDT